MDPKISSPTCRTCCLQVPRSIPIPNNSRFQACWCRYQRDVLLPLLLRRPESVCVHPFCVERDAWRRRGGGWRTLFSSALTKRTHSRATGGTGSLKILRRRRRGRALSVFVFPFLPPTGITLMDLWFYFIFFLFPFDLFVLSIGLLFFASGHSISGRYFSPYV